MQATSTARSPLVPVNGYDFARSVLDQEPDRGVEILLQAAGENESDWLEKKAAVYRSESKDERFRKALENCPPEQRKRRKDLLNLELLAEIAKAIVAIHNSRGGVLFVGIDDQTNEPVSFENNDGGEIWRTNGKGDYALKAVWGRLARENGEFRFDHETLIVPVEAVGVVPKWCRYKNADVLALLIPPLAPEKNPLEVTHVENNSPWRSIPKRAPGDVGQVKKEMRNDAWIGSAAQLADFHHARQERFLNQTDLASKLKILGLSVPSSFVSQIPKPRQEITSTVDRPRAANFVGREKELEELHELLADGRIPVVTGPGGTGKSELVLQYAARNKADYPGGLFQIDMEDVTDWNQTFLSMLEKPGVRDVLGLPVNNEAEIECEAEKEPSVNSAELAADGTGMPCDNCLRESIAGDKKSVPAALSARVGRAGPILMILDNVDPPACKTLFKETVLSKLGLPSDVKIVATARASDLTFPASGVCKEFRLSDLLPDVAVRFLLANHPEASEDERKAAENIARMLDYRILYLKAVPSLLEDDDSDFAGSWRALEAGLRDNLADVVAAGMEDDRGRTPSALWQLTQKAFAANRPKGDRWILLARIASFFSPDLGIRKAALSALWKSISAPDGDLDIAFDQAINKLLKHGILEDRDGEYYMHRLTCAAIRAASREEAPNIEESVGLSLAGTGRSESRDWVSLSGSIPALRHVPEALLDGKTCVDILCGNRQFADLCPWTKLDYSDWRKLLAFHPQFIDQLQQSADNGSAGAQIALGICYYYGRGVNQNYEEAVKWFRKAAEQENAAAYSNLGVCYEKGRGVERNAEEAAKWYRKAANQENATAQTNLGNCYYNGCGVEQSSEEAVKWYLKAAEKGNADAQFNLGVCYGNGHGVDRSAEEAVKWYRKAAEQEDAAAQARLGLCYEEGEGVERNAEEAVKWYRKAAEQGNASAQTKLGYCKNDGRGIERSVEDAVKWWQKAAERGYAPAQWELGSCFALGKGVARNEEEAVNWWRKAADQGNPWRQIRLGRVLLFGNGVEKNEAEAFRWFQRAAEQKDDYAFAWLGYCFASGTGTPKDTQKSESLFLKISQPALGFNEIAWCLFKAGRFSDALPFAERAVAALRTIEDFPMQKRIIILDTLAAIFHHLNREEETKDVCSEILSLFPENDDSKHHEEALVRLGRACQRLGDKSGAVDAFQKALTIVERHDGKHAEYGESADSLRALLAELSERG